MQVTTGLMYGWLRPSCVVLGGGTRKGTKAWIKRGGAGQAHTLFRPLRSASLAPTFPGCVVARVQSNSDRRHTRAGETQLAYFAHG